MGRHVGFESWLERDHLMLLDHDPAVLGVASQPFWLFWATPEGKVRSHVPDYFARLADGGALVVDCRPVEQRVKPTDLAKFDATRRACDLVGWQYRLVGTPDAIVVANVRWLAGYRHPRHELPTVAGALREVFTAPRPLMAGAETVGAPIAVLPVLFHLLWRHDLAADLSVPLHPDPSDAVRAGGCVMAAGRAVLRPGDRVHFDGGEHQVVGLAGASVRLRSDDGAEQVVLAGHLMAAPGFAVVDAEPATTVEPFGRVFVSETFEALTQLGRTHERAVRKRHPDQRHRLPVLYVTVPPAATTRMLAVEFARFFGREFSSRANITDIVNAVCANAARSGIELVLVDEIHNLNLATPTPSRSTTPPNTPPPHGRAAHRPPAGRVEVPA